MSVVRSVSVQFITSDIICKLNRQKAWLNTAVLSSLLAASIYTSMLDSKFEALGQHKAGNKKAQ